MTFMQLVTLVVAGVIVADLVSHIAGTQALFNGFNILWSIGTQPTNTALLSTPVGGSAVSKNPVNNTRKA